MTVVALLLLPAQGVLLYAMDRLEDRFLTAQDPPGRPARHARPRHLRLVRGAASDTSGSGAGERRAEAA
ncbi:hypothetical protein ACGFS9_08230 [Streptomyces sp. NPDC048566]|uniref:hypothetical protein n=1 Tax=Streptomyces sp. NPDC048566 TaxID=3365569 RepID=UPI003722D361